MKKVFLIILLTCVFFPQFTHADITSNLTVHWKFNEGTGTTAADATGNGNTGTLQGTAGWNSSTPKIGASSVSYPGTNGNGTSFTTMNPGTTFTYAGWIQRTAGTIGAFENIIANGNSIGLWMTSDGKIDFDAGGAHKNTTALTQSTWHHFVVVDNATAVTFYLDGSADGTATVANNMFFNGMGCDSGTGAECFTGYNDDVRIYSRALSSSDVSELYLYTEGGAAEDVRAPSFQEF